MGKTKKLIKEVKSSFELIKKRYGKSSHYPRTPKLQFIKSKNMGINKATDSIQRSKPSILKMGRKSRI